MYRIVEEVDTRSCVVHEPEQIRRDHGRHRHRRHPEEGLAGQADEEQHQIHVRRIELRARDLRSPREPARSRENQRKREDRERKRGRVEDMRTPAVPIPGNQLLGGEAERDHQELEVEPVRFEPEKEVDAEDDGKWTEAKRVVAAPRPAEQHVEAVGEQELGGDEVKGLQNRRPVQPQYSSTDACAQA